MSYILDALKKSDQQRQSADVPNLQTVYIPVTAEPQAPWGLYGFILILLLALVFVIGMMVAGSGPSEQQVAVKNAAELAVNQPEEATHNTESAVRSQADGQKQLYEPRLSLENNTLLSRQTANVGRADRAENMPVSASVTDGVTASETPNSSGNSSDSGTVTDLQTIPYLEELADYKQQSIPQLKFAGHVYSSTPASRSVIINGFAMAEGDIIVQGLVVEKITPNGVVFSFHNELFRMNILQDWSFE